MRRGFEHAGLGERIEQRALAGVGIADQRDDGNRHGLAALTLLVADAADRFELALDVVDAEVDLAAIGLELRLARAAGSDAAAKLRHGAPRPARRGSWYSSCASSTWSWPSRVRAWRAKMSRMSCVRSMTWQGSRAPDCEAATG